MMSNASALHRSRMHFQAARQRERYLRRSHFQTAAAAAAAYRLLRN